jgi:hypothetical protein
MPDASLKINILADGTQATTELKKVSTAVDQTGEMVKKSKQTFDVYNNTLNQSSAYAKTATEIELRQAKALEELRAQAEKARAALAATGDTTKGLSATAAGLHDVGEGAKNALGPVNEFYQVIRRAAYVLPGIGVAGIVGALAAGVAELASVLIDFGKAGVNTADIIAETDKSFEKAATDVFTLKENVELAKQGFLDKDKVVKEYNDTLGKTTGQVKTLGEVEAKLASQGDAYIRFTLLKAAAQVAYAKAAEAAFQVALDTQKSIQDFQTLATNAKAFGQGQSSAPGFVPGIDPLAGFKARADAAAAAKAKLIAEAKDTEDKLLAIGNDFQKQAAAIAAANNFNFFGDTKTDTTQAKQIQDQNLAFLKETKKALEDIDKISTKPLFEQFKNLDQSGIGVSVAGSVEGGLAKINFDIYQAELAKATKAAAEGSITQETFKGVATALHDAFIKTGTPNLKVKISFVLDETDKGQEDPGDAIAKQFKKVNPKGFLNLIEIGGFNQAQVADALTAAEKFGRDIGKILVNGLSDTLSNVGDAIGKAIVGGGDIGAAATEALLSTIGELLENLGKAMILLGIAQKVAIDSLKTLNPYVAIAAGFAAVIAGAAVKAAATKPHAFAEGGIVTGPTLGLIGEAGPEAVVPLRQLGSFARNASSPAMDVNVIGQISGNVIRLLLDRDKKYNGLV